jgi:hypothetical protein
MALLRTPLLLICCSAAPAMAQAPAAARPVLIRGALVVDGSGGPADLMLLDTASLAARATPKEPHLTGRSAR